MQGTSTTKDYLNTAVRTVLFLGLPIFCATFAYQVGIEHIHSLHLINVVLDIFGMLVGCIMLVGLFLDKRKTGGTARYLEALIIIVYIALLSDAVEYISDCIGDYYTLNLFVTTIYYIAVPAEAVLFFRYTIHYLNIKNSRLAIINRLMFAGFIIAVVIRLVNIKYGFYFYIDNDGIYHRGPQYLLSKVFFIGVMLVTLTIIIKRRKQLNKVQLVAVVLYAVAPLSFGVTSLIFSGLSITPITSMMVALFMYCSLNVTQGREVAVAEHEISIASSIQENVLPKAFPYLPEKKEFDIYAIMKPAKEVGGDFYDFFMVDDNHLALVIADVSGKGIPAALFMMTSRTLIKNRVQAGDSLSIALADINNQLCEGNVADLFVTVWVGILDLNTGCGVAVNAGHEHPIIKKSGSGYEAVIYKHDLALAMFENQNFTEREFKLDPGDYLFVYTDGVPEIMNEKGDLFGIDRLVDTLNQNPDFSPKETIDNVLKAVDIFANGAEQFDDTTMLCLKYNGIV